MTKDEALKMAIDLLELYNNHIYRTGNANDVINACKEALERPSNMVAVPLDKLQDMQRRLKALEQPAQRNFCERCGKRASKDAYHIHTCTPPQALKEKNYVS
jgi:hypothetical protein